MMVVPEIKHLVLVGGGHAQVAVLKDLAMRPLAGLRVTLISRDIMTPYSGMLPGYLEGIYDSEEIVIDLSHLARIAGARFVAASIEAIDPKTKTITIEGRPPLSYDILSLNIGSATDLLAIEGAEKYALPIKPISTLLGRLEPILSAGKGQKIAIIGGGAAGVETALSLYQRLLGRGCSITLIHRGKRLTPEYPLLASLLLKRELGAKGIEVILEKEVKKITAKNLTLDDGDKIDCDLPLIVTAGAPPQWLKTSGLTLDDNGFIAIKRSLQSLNHEEVFASGDIATLTCDARPKAGVFAVRAGKILAHNLRQVLTDKKLKDWYPQKRYLALIGTGNKKAMPIHGRFTLPTTRLGWIWKEYIDRKFMNRFNQLPPMPEPKPQGLHALAHEENHDPALASMRCLGCGAKAGFGTLQDAFIETEKLVKKQFPNATPFTQIEADSAAIEIKQVEIIQSLDALSAIVDDPFMLGRIAALHAMSDLFASHAKPIAALAVLTLPSAIARLQQDDITQILAGATLALTEEGASLNGGHTAEASAMQVGFSVTGTPIKGEQHAPSDGDILVLTKPLGIGIIMAGHAMGSGAASGTIRESAIQSMAKSNGIAANIFARHGLFPMTDITGFGLARHTLSLLERYGQGFSAEFNHPNLPLLDGVEALIEEGVTSSLAGANKNAVPLVMLAPVDDTIYSDPQTGGGLLAAIPKAKIKKLLADCKKQGVIVKPIGKIVADGLGQIRIKNTPLGL